MERRKFLKLLGAGSLLSFGGSLVLPSFRKNVYNMLRAETSSLQVSEQVINSFLQDAEIEHYWQRFPLIKRTFFNTHYLLANTPLWLPYSSKFASYRREIVGAFLLSTDFFRHKMDVSRPVRYMAFFNPYKQACSNPFSSLYYADQVSETLAPC